MKEITAEFIRDKTVLLRYDLDVPIKEGKVTEDFRLKAGLKTLKMCLEHGKQVIMIGHIGRPVGEDSKFSVEPIYNWLLTNNLRSHLESGKLKLLENLRFEAGEDGCDLEYAKEILKLVEYAGQDDGHLVYINEAFAAHHKAASTTVLPTLLPHAAGLNFIKEVTELTKLREQPKRPFVVIIGGIKVEDKLEVIQAMSKTADYILVGGKLIWEIKQLGIELKDNVLVGNLNEAGTDIDNDTITSWKEKITQAKNIFWNGPVGKIEVESMKYEVGNMGSAEGTYQLAKLILDSEAEVVIGGGDTGGFLGRIDLLDEFIKKGFVSTGGGASGKFLTDGSLPTIEALND